MINIVGCGPGAEEYLTAIARTIIADSDVLIGSRRLLELARNNPARKIAVTADVSDAVENIRNLHTGKNNVSLLVSGDPGIFSLARRVIEAFGIVNCRVIPGISSVQTAFAGIGAAWDDALIVSAHHRLPDIDDAALNSARKIAVLSGRQDAADWLRKLIARFAGAVTVYACENLTLENERVSKFDDGALPDRPFAPRCVFLLIRKGQEP